ncbi:MAG: hypothetical protein CM1200mP36_08940 [Gammaproteobacteria bacterium]|nr:MAG: hypothetical protein CM1200mP36_08940 [Gammaproteobacteria bacterium]
MAIGKHRWIESHGTLAWLIYIAAYTVAAVLVIPSGVLTLAADSFGSPLENTRFSGQLKGHPLPFLGGFLARDWVTQRIRFS